MESLPNIQARMKGMTMDSRKLLRIVVVVGFLLLLVLAKPFVIVRAGTVGVVYSFGSIVGQVDEGFHLVWPWWFITHTDIKVQRAVLDKLPSFSAETQDVFVRASLNYQVYGSTSTSPRSTRCTGAQRSLKPTLFSSTKRITRSRQSGRRSSIATRKRPSSA